MEVQYPLDSIEIQDIIIIVVQRSNSIMMRFHDHIYTIIRDVNHRSASHCMYCDNCINMHS